MMAAVLTTEDGGFWRHRGFLPSQFEVALRRNLVAGGVRLGASTITMQLVKNLLLSHERTLSRKFQELVLTWYVESVLDKERIMELYLNAIEYGPGMYGVGRAARHYFGKEAAYLTPKEAVFLALLLPSPLKRHLQYCRGEMSPAFEVKVDRVLNLMLTKGRLSQVEYDLYRDQSLVFDLTERGTPSSCERRVRELQQGIHTQRARSGLLAEEPGP